MNTDLLFESPWWLPVAIAAVGAVVFYTANRRREVKLRTVGLAVIALGVAVALVSHFVKTDKEKVEDQTRRLVEAFQKQEWETMRSLLHPKASVGIANLPLSLYSDRDQIVDRASEAHGRYGFKSARITSVEAQQDKSLITVSMTLWTVQDFTMGRPIRSTWEVEWLQNESGWSLYKLRAIEIANQQTDRIEPMFPGRR